MGDGVGVLEGVGHWAEGEVREISDELGKRVISNRLFVEVKQEVDPPKVKNSPKKTVNASPIATVAPVE